MLIRTQALVLLTVLSVSLYLLCCPKIVLATLSETTEQSGALSLHPLSTPDEPSFIQWQDSLRGLGFRMYNEIAEPERLKANFSFVKTLVSALKLRHSFDFAFEGLDMVSIKKSPDGTFRIFSWHLPLSDGSYLYYGTIQLRTSDGSLKLYPLLDKTYEIAEPFQAIASSADWYGAQYYDIIPYKDSYLLLGWKGHTPAVTHKVIEVLSFDVLNDRAIFGKKIFDAPDYREHSRVIFKFARGVSMHLVFQAGPRRIIFDNLVPADPSYDGQYAYYGPDLTFDAWVLGAEKLILTEHVSYDQEGAGGLD